VLLEGGEQWKGGGNWVREEGPYSPHRMKESGPLFSVSSSWNQSFEDFKFANTGGKKSAVGGLESVSETLEREKSLAGRRFGRNFSN